MEYVPSVASRRDASDTVEFMSHYPRISILHSRHCVRYRHIRVLRKQRTMVAEHGNINNCLWCGHHSFSIKNGQIHCTCATDWLRYVGSLLVNWPEMKQYGALCLLEWKLHKLPASSAHLVPEWNERRVNIVRLKFMEGVWEACPQAILQLCLLVPDLYGDWTWTDYLRVAGASVSLCTAGAALVNWERLARIYNYNDLPLSELVVLHVWAVPVTVSRLLSVSL